MGTIKKKYTIIFLVVCAILFVVYILIKLDIGRKNQRALRVIENAKQLIAKVKEETSFMSGKKLLSPQDIIEREKKFTEGELPIPRTTLPIEKELTSPKVITKEEIKLVATDGLRDMLRLVLDQNKPSYLYLVLKEMEKRGLKPVPILREEILNNPDDPLIRKNAILGLFYMGVEDVLPIIKTSVKLDPDKDVRLFALFCLDFLSGKEESEFFKDIFETDPSEDVRSKAKEYWEFRSKGQ
ncbi:MAG: HEAT repeat domain-containing protein [Candidatus Omnitrophica bacterium]|nr:HEAT repeat domain-containing protein [Candidatus Omnitrophota bacterium]MCM8826846.1 HEAT repeat domain-containing protein [Candidatus Omnitrophota bacterium]